MPARENINSGNIKYLEIRDHSGVETYFKSSNRWYKVSHESGYISDINKVGFNQVDKEIAWIKEPGYFRVYNPTERKKYNKTQIPPHPNATLVFYDIKISNPHFWYGEDDIKVSARQIVKNYDKIRKKIHSSDAWIFRSKIKKY